MKWKHSKAKALLYDDLVNGIVPIKARDANNRSTMKLKDIYDLRPEYKLYHYSKFSSRLSTLRGTVADNLTRQKIDQKAFDDYISRHKDEVSHTSAKGYIQWQGSQAQKLVQETLANNANEALEWQEWHSSDPEFHMNFPLDVFRDKVNQEIRTNKYLYTLKVRGKDTRKTKEKMKPKDHRPPMED